MSKVRKIIWHKESGIINVVFPIIILFSLYMLFQGWVPHWGAVILISLLVGVLIFAFSSKGLFQRRYFIYFLFFCVIVGIKVLIGNTYWDVGLFNLLSSGLMMALGLMVSNYYLTGINEETLGKRVITTFHFIVVLTTIATAVLSIANPQIIRYAMEENNFFDNKVILTQLYKSGMSNYYLPHALPVIIPPFVCLAKNDKRKKSHRWGAVLIISLCLLLIYFSGAMTALLLGIVSLLGALVITSNAKKNVVRLLLALGLLLPLILNDDLVLSGLRSIENVLGSDNYFYDKIVDFENSIKNDTAEGGIETRSSLYTISLQEFIKNPVFGTENEVGGHSVLLDFMASLGIVGFLPFLLMLFSLCVWVKRMLPAKVQPYYAYGFLIGVIMLGVKSMNNLEMWFCLFALLPILSKESVVEYR